MAKNPRSGSQKRKEKGEEPGADLNRGGEDVAAPQPQRLEDEAEVPDQVPKWALKPLDKLLNDELLDKINQAIFTLPEKYRLVIVLRDIEGFSTAETAQILNLSDANVKVRLHRARLFLRDKLKGYFENE